MGCNFFFFSSYYLVVDQNMFFKRYFKLRFHSVKKNHTCLCYTHIINVEVFRYSQLSWTFFFEKEEKLIIVCLFLFLSLSFYRHSLFLNIFKIIEDYFVLLLFFLSTLEYEHNIQSIFLFALLVTTLFMKKHYFGTNSIVPPSSILFFTHCAFILPYTAPNPCPTIYNLFRTLIFPTPTW